MQKYIVKSKATTTWRTLFLYLCIVTVLYKVFYINKQLLLVFFNLIFYSFFFLVMLERNNTLSCIFMKALLNFILNQMDCSKIN
jgi:hypothetical protein